MTRMLSIITYNTVFNRSDPVFARTQGSCAVTYWLHRMRTCSKKHELDKLKSTVICAAVSFPFIILNLNPMAVVNGKHNCVPTAKICSLHRACSAACGRRPQRSGPVTSGCRRPSFSHPQLLWGNENHQRCNIDLGYRQAKETHKINNTQRRKNLHIMPTDTHQ